MFVVLSQEVYQEFIDRVMHRTLRFNATREQCKRRREARIGWREFCVHANVQQQQIEMLPWELPPHHR